MSDVSPDLQTSQLYQADTHEGDISFRHKKTVPARRKLTKLEKKELRL
jgi:hypothetical protein